MILLRMSSPPAHLLILTEATFLRARNDEILLVFVYMSHSENKRFNIFELGQQEGTLVTALWKSRHHASSSIVFQDV